MSGSRGVEFEPGGPPAGTPTGEATEANVEIMKRPIPPKKGRTPDDIRYGRG